MERVKYFELSIPTGKVVGYILGLSLLNEIKSRRACVRLHGIFKFYVSLNFQVLEPLMDAQFHSLSVQWLSYLEGYYVSSEFGVIDRRMMDGRMDGW